MIPFEHFVPIVRFEIQLQLAPSRCSKMEYPAKLSAALLTRLNLSAVDYQEKRICFESLKNHVNYFTYLQHLFVNSDEFHSLDTLKQSVIEMSHRDVRQFEILEISLSNVKIIPETPKKRKIEDASLDMTNSPAIRNLANEFYKVSSQSPSSPHCFATRKENEIATFKASLDCFSLDALQVELEKYFNSCSKSPETFIKMILDELLDVISTKVSFKFKNSSFVLFYRCLINMLNRESDRTGLKDFTKWLFDRNFHSSLALCCFQTMYLCQCDVSLIEIVSLKDLGICAFEFCVFLETFVRFERLNSFFINHFRELEARLLESEVWQDQFPIYHRTKNDSVFWNSPKKALASISENEILNSKKSENALTKMELFYRKLFRLASSKISAITRYFNIQLHFKRLFWSLFVHVVVYEHDLLLLYKRNLDVIIVCIIYSICKIMDCDRTFKELLSFYQRSGTQEVIDFYKLKRFKSIYLHEGDRYSDVVVFYNTVFLAKLKEVIYSLKNAQSAEKLEIIDSPLPSEKRFKGALRIPSSSVFVSPMKTISPMTPTSSRLYNFGESPFTPSQQSCSLKPTSSAVRKLKFE